MVTPSKGLCVRPLSVSGALDAEHVQDRRHYVDGVVVLVADLTACRHAGRPGDDARIARAAVELVALPHLERRVERHGPAVRVVVVRRRGCRARRAAARLASTTSGMPLANFISFDRPVRAALARRAVVRDDDHDGVLAPAGLLEEAEQPSDLGSRRGRGTRRRPRPCGRTGACSSAVSESHGNVTSSGGNGLPSGPVRVLGVPIGLSGGSSAWGGKMPISFCRANVSARRASVAAAEARLVLADFVGSTVRARSVVRSHGSRGRYQRAAVRCRACRTQAGRG